MCILAAFFDNLWNHLNGGINLWTIFGLTGNIMFTSRFVVQWYVSEKLKQSVIPKNFWHLSFLGGLINLIYALHVGAVPFILGSLLPPVVAARNLILISRQGDASPPSSGGTPPPATPPAPDDDGSASMLATHEAITR